MSSISVSKASSVISSLLCRSGDFQGGGKGAALNLQNHLFKLYRAGYVSGFHKRQASGVQRNVRFLRDQLHFKTEYEINAPKLSSVRLRRQQEVRNCEKAKQIYMENSLY